MTTIRPSRPTELALACLALAAIWAEASVRPDPTWTSPATALAAAHSLVAAGNAEIGLSVGTALESHTPALES
jgi:hypothetical protein